MGQDTKALSEQKGKPARKKPRERATADERKSVLDAAMAILEKRRGKKINNKTGAGKMKKTARPRRPRKTGATATPKTSKKKGTVPDLPLPEESAPNGLPRPREEKLKNRLVTARAGRTKPKTVDGKKKFEAAERAKARRAAAKKKADEAFARQRTATFPDDILRDTVNSEPSLQQAGMKEEVIKEEYEKKLRAEREARLKAEARSRVEDTARKILKAEREEKRRIKDELESKLKMETQAKSAILRELDELKMEMGNLRAGTTERMNAECEIMRLRDMLAERDREIFRYKKQIDERANKKITAIIETIQTRKAPRPAAPEAVPEAAAEISSKSDSVFTSLGDLSKDNPIFDGLPTIELEKPEPEKETQAETKGAAVETGATPVNRIAYYLSSTRGKSRRYRQALLVALPIAFLVLVVLGARAFFSNAPGETDLAQMPEQQIEQTVAGEDNSVTGVIRQTERAAIGGASWNPAAAPAGPAIENRGGPSALVPIQFDGQRRMFPEMEAPKPPKPKDKIYKVKPGDSLWVICRKEYGSGIHHEALSKYNNLKKGQILKIGMELKLPPKDILVPPKKKKAVKKASEVKREPYRSW
ncbi:MAG: LysM peptidoglycan-binding domain-containing protein [Planctomycetota bacterium]|nr:MAG: LysM peptidoglycan-binding domain-containing protein [Planctomycetota bacterium]